MRGIATVTGGFSVLLFSLLANASTITVQHNSGSGTSSSPWDGASIATAIASAQVGDVVVVPNGYWLVTSDLANTNGGFTLRGQSRSVSGTSTPQSIVQFNQGSWQLGTYGPTSVSNVSIMDLTIDASHANDNSHHTN